MAEISVVLATITADDWLRESVHSILAQEGVDHELILVLDGLPRSAVEEYDGLERLKVVPIPTRSGLANALAVGIQNSDAKYIGRLDADDHCLPGRLRTQFEYLEAHSNAVLVGTRAVVIDELGHQIGGTAGPDESDLREHLICRNQFTHSSVMFLREAYLQAGGYDATLRQMEDYDLWLRLAHEGALARLGKPLTSYRIHGNQMSKRASPNKNYTRKIFREQIRLGRKLGLPISRRLGLPIVWLLAQYASWAKVRPSGHARNIAKS